MLYQKKKEQQGTAPLGVEWELEQMKTRMLRCGKFCFFNVLVSPNLGWRTEDNFSLNKIFWVKANLSILLNSIAMPRIAPV